MDASPSFSNLLAQPGPSEAPVSPPSAHGGVVLNDHARQAVMQDPLQQARIRTQTSLNALKTLAQKIAQDQTSVL